MLGCEGEDLGLELKLSSDRYLGRPLDNHPIIFDVFLEGYVNSVPLWSLHPFPFLSCIKLLRKRYHNCSKLEMLLVRNA